MYQLFLSIKFLRSKNREKFIAFNSYASIIGIALGVTALVVVLSIMNGFQKELRERILAMASHLTVYGYKKNIEEPSKLIKILEDYKSVAGAAQNITEQAMLSYKDKVKGVVVKGIDLDAERKVSDIRDKLIAGKYRDLEKIKYSVFIGVEMANLFDIGVGDYISLIVPSSGGSIMSSLPRVKKFSVVGIFQVGMAEYDEAYIYSDINNIAKLFSYSANTVSNIQIKLDDLFDAIKVKQELKENLPIQLLQDIFFIDWQSSNKNFFKAIELEKKIMFIVLTILILVACFNVVTTMIMVVTDKKNDIAILRTIGMSKFNIKLIFILQGVIISLIGIIIGLFVGILIASNISSIVPFLEGLFQFKFFPEDVYYISEVPSDIKLGDLVKICALAFFLTLIAAVYPAHKASKVNPAKQMSYE